MANKTSKHKRLEVGADIFVRKCRLFACWQFFKSII